MTDDTPSTILLVEDDEDIGAFLVQVFQEERPYVVLHLTDGAHALEAVRSVKPNVFLLDYQLPGIDGLELYDRLHQTAGLEHVPALVMSANSPPPKELRKREVAFIAKPFEIADLLTAVDALLPKKGSEELRPEERKQ